MTTIDSPDIESRPEWTKLAALTEPKEEPPMSDLRDTALASLICERNDHPDAPACDGCYAMAAHLRENGYVLSASSSTEAGLDDLIADGRKWRAAEAEGHVVTFSLSGYGLMHPPSCRPDLIGCWFNTYLASRRYPEEEPGRYRMTRHKGHAEYDALATTTPEGA